MEKSNRTTAVEPAKLVESMDDMLTELINFFEESICINEKFN